MDYKDILKEAVNSQSTPFEVASWIEEHFPELKESEDERIKKEIIELVMQPTWKTEKEFHRRKELCAWIEKQSEQTSKHFELKAGHWYICHRAFCCRADHLTVKEGERFICEKDGIVKGFVFKEPEKYFKEVCAPIPMENEQKPAWSEKGTKGNDREIPNSEHNSAWCEVDEACANLILKELEQGKKELPDYSKHFARLIDWFTNRFKSLRPQNTWKPSERKIQSVRDCALNKNIDADTRLVLDALYQDLLKLRDE